MHAVTTVDEALRRLRYERHVLGGEIFYFRPGGAPHTARLEQLRKMAARIEQLRQQQRLERVAAEPKPPVLVSPQPTPLTVVQPRPYFPRFIPEQATHTLPLPSVPRETRDADIVGYDVFWNGSSKRSLIGSYTRKAARPRA